MTRKEYQEARALIDQADELYGDLPDGAYWAACEEFGADMYLQIEVDEYEMANNLGVHEHERPTTNSHSKKGKGGRKLQQRKSSSEGHS